MQHNGVCGFCGTRVNEGFNTCAACGATWRSGTGNILIQTIAFLGMVPTLVLGVIAFAYWKMTFEGIVGPYHYTVTAGSTVATIVTFALSNKLFRKSQTWAWFR